MEIKFGPALFSRLCTNVLLHLKRGSVLGSYCEELVVLEALGNADNCEVRPTGFEPATLWSELRDANH